MIDEVVSKLLQRMTGKLTEDELHDLDVEMRIVLNDYEISIRNTELMTGIQSCDYYLKLFLARKHTEGKSARTIKSYKYQLSRLFEKLNMPVDRITENDLFLYLAVLKKVNKCSNVYLDNLRLIFSSFFSWMTNKGYISKNPARGLSPLKKENIIKKPFTDEELERLKQACIDDREKALLEVLYSTGMRVGEIVNLNIENIDFRDMSCIIKGKGGKQREVYLTATACMYLKSYLSMRADDNSAVFVSERKPYERLMIGGVQKLLHKIADRAGVENVHPHRFRRTFATNVLKKGMPVVEVRELLGHAKLDTTMIYCTVSKENVKASHRRLMCA